MKYLLVLFAICTIPFTATAANAPSQQKVIREVVIKASPEKVWNLVKDFGAIHQWHPAVTETKLETRKDEAGADVQHRLLTLNGGGTLLEKLIGVTDSSMKIEYRIIEGVLPVSGYRAIMQVKAGPNADESTVTWTGRFYNKANKVDAPVGEDNATAVKAIEGVYDAGLPNLKKVIEAQ
ncbi:MAG: SRPBCC family protein [Methylotenera sp.]|nr:SRPBCC family protein [Methylotenera sp.]